MRCRNSSPCTSAEGHVCGRRLIDKSFFTFGEFRCAQLRLSPNWGKTGSEQQRHRYPHHSGAAGSRQARHDSARYTGVATGMIANVESPLDLLSQSRKKPGSTGKTHRRRKRPRACPVQRWRSRISCATTAFCQCRTRQPRPVKGDGSDRTLPHGGARRPCRALRGLRTHAHRLQLLPQPQQRRHSPMAAFLSPWTSPSTRSWRT
jgi:hypothetical protein